MKILLPLLIGLCAARAAAAPATRPADAAWLEARRRVEAAWQAVQAGPGRGDAAAERRSFAVDEEGHRLFGSSYSRAESLAILALMGDWLRTPRKSSSAALLLEEAARAAHPQIGDGSAARGARNWAAFVLSLS